MITRNEAKRKIKALGWSQRKIAPMLSVTFPHLNYVLNGHRESRRLLAQIESFTAMPLPVAAERMEREARKKLQRQKNQNS